MRLPQNGAEIFLTILLVENSINKFQKCTDVLGGKKEEEVTSKLFNFDKASNTVLYSI